MKQFLPFLTDDEGRSLTVENEVVVTRSLPDPLDNSPDGWEGNTIQFARNNEFRGIIKSYTTSLKFYLHGAKILRDAFYRKGIEAVLFFIWLKLDQTFGGGMTYKDWYKGEPDFGTFKDDYNGVSINITEGGFYKDLQANKGIVQEIPFDDAAKMLYLDGMIFYNTINYTLVEVEEEFTGGGDIIGFGNTFTIPLFLKSQEGASAGITFLSVSSEQLGSVPTYMASSSNWLARNDGLVPVTFPISGHIDFNSTEADDVTMRLDLRSSGGTNYEIIPVTAINTGVNYVFSFSFSITLEPGEKLFSFRQMFGQEFTGGYTEATEVTATTVTRPEASVILAYRVFDLGNKLTARVSTGASLSSTLLETDYNLLVTSGDAIRGIPDPVIKSTFSDWHKSVDAVKCIALEVLNNNPVVSSRYDKFDKDSQIADLGECSNWSLEPAQDYIYDVVQVGYPSKSADSNIDLNGRYSFNNTFTWKINKTRRTATTYDAVSKYYADPYDIELIRLNLNGKSTTTGSTDNSNFFIDAEPKDDVSFTGTIHFYHTNNQIELVGDVAAITPFIIVGGKLTINGQVWTIKTINGIDVLDINVEVQEFIAVSSDITGTATVTNLYQLRRPVFDSIEGIPDDGSVFNLLLSPGHIFKNHWRWVRSSCDHLDGSKFIFQTTEKNKDLITVLDGVTIIEKADIPVSIMGERVYLPYYTTFEVASPTNLLELMTGNSGGKFDYSSKSVAMDGFPIDVKSVDPTLETQQYKLLMTANNDNLRLINGR